MQRQAHKSSADRPASIMTYHYREQFLDYFRRCRLDGVGSEAALLMRLQARAGRFILLTGGPGAGKSASLVRLHDSIREAEGAVWIYSIGRQSGISSIASLGRAIRSDLSEVDGCENKEAVEIPEILSSIRTGFEVTLLLDGVERLNGGHELYWLPRRVKDNVRLIISYSAGGDPRILDRLRRISPGNEISMPPASLELRAGQAAAALARFPGIESPLRRFLESEACSNPLFSRIACHEIDTCTTEIAAQEKLNSLQVVDNVRDAAVMLFRRLEEHCGFELVKTLAPAFGVARRGLSLAELARIANIPSTSKALELWHAGLDPFLIEVRGVFSYINPMFEEVAQNLYCGHGSQVMALRNAISDSFENQPVCEPGSGAVNRRRADELFWQLLQLRQWDRIEKLICDPLFVYARANTGNFEDWDDDFGEAISSLRTNSEDESGRARLSPYTELLVAYAAARTEGIEEQSSPPFPDPPVSIRPFALEGETDRQQGDDYATRIAAFQGLFHPYRELLYSGTEAAVAAIHIVYNQSENPIARLSALNAVEHLERKPPLLLRSTFPDPNTTALPSSNDSWLQRVVFTPDLKNVLCTYGGDRKEMTVWDRQTASVIRHIPVAARGLAVAAVTPDDSRVIASSDPRAQLARQEEFSILLFDLRQGHLLGRLQGHNNLIASLAVSPGGRYLLAGALDTEPHSYSRGNRRYEEPLWLWDLTRGVCVQRFAVPHEVRFALWLPGGQLVVTDGSRPSYSSTQPSRLLFWNPRTGRLESELDFGLDAVTDICPTPDGQRLLVGLSKSHGSGSALTLLDLKSGHPVWSTASLPDGVNRVHVTPDAKTALTSSSRGLRVWDLGSGECLSYAPGREVRSTAIAGPYIAAAGIGQKRRHQEELVVVEMLNRARGAGIATPVRLYDFEGGDWQPDLTVRCGWCGQLNPLPTGRVSTCGGCLIGLELNPFVVDEA